ncbi:hypothetical protein EG68_12262 [Paragonimus skrjabini miyazakii]|uniref:Uncharacterized protein n=1 Tax=Paragonimus skrjabini miyazakii TaxID=59628 RepID=A0A8S9YD72_9TREM|nr:hypothetical protein EG68_12262 [Paragonimus skrjabini miyazakii]
MHVGKVILLTVPEEVEDILAISNMTQNPNTVAIMKHDNCSLIMLTGLLSQFLTEYFYRVSFILPLLTVYVWTYYLYR